MEAAQNITPLPRQAVALSCPAFELMYGGQKGGAKTFFMCLCWGPLIKRAHERKLLTGVEQRHCRIPIFRKNLGDLKDIINKSHRVFPCFDQNARYNSNEKIWHFWSGATIEFHHLDGPDDHTGWNGQEIMGLGIDQAEEISSEVRAFLIAQVRTSDENYKDLLQVRLTANPGGRHGDDLYKRFIAPHPPGNKIIVEEIENRDGRRVEVTRAFIPSALQDNPYLNADGMYEARLRATLPDHLLKMYLEGDWNAVVGAFFSSRVFPHKHLMQSFPIPGSWDVKFGLDWGASNPAATIWGAKDPATDRIYIIDELYLPGDTGRIYGEKMAKKVVRQQWSAERKWKTDDFYGLIDSQAMSKSGSVGTAAGGIAGNGFRIFAANKERHTGITQILERLAMRSDGKPGVIIFADRCPNLIRTLPTIRTNPVNPEDYDPDGEGHAIDAFRFLLMDWPMYMGKKADPIDEQVEQWERMLRRHPVQADRDDEVNTGYGD